MSAHLQYWARLQREHRSSAAACLLQPSQIVSPAAGIGAAACWTAWVVTNEASTEGSLVLLLPPMPPASCAFKGPTMGWEEVMLPSSGFTQACIG